MSTLPFTAIPSRLSIPLLTFSIILSGCSGGVSEDTNTLGAAGEIGGINGLQGSSEEPLANTATSDEPFLGDNILIMNRNSGRALEAAENRDGGNVEIFADSGFSNQRWSIAKVGQAFSIRSMQDDTRAMETWGAGTVDDTNIALQTYYGSDSQLYAIDEADSGWYVVKPVIAADQCVDAFGLGDEANVGTWSCHGGDSQHWTFKKESSGTDKPVDQSTQMLQQEVLPYQVGRLGVEGQITYNLELDGVEASLAAGIAKSMEEAVKFYNDNGVFTQQISVNYQDGAPKTTGGDGATITFGSEPNTRMALHEVSHTLGIGTHSNWNRLQQNGMWTGAAGNAKYSEFEGADSRIEVNSGHILNTYGLNYDWHENDLNNSRHIQLVIAMRCDMGLGQCSGVEGNDIVIVSRSSGKVLDVAGNDQGSNIRVYTDYEAENQRWNITSVGGGMYKIITSQNGNKAVDTWAHGTTDGTNIALWDYTPSGNRHFYIEEVDTGWFRIKPSIADSKCLVAYSDESDFNVGIWECDGRANMQWGFNRSVVVAEPDDTDEEEERPEPQPEPEPEPEPAPAPAPEPEPEIEPREYRDPPYYGSIFISTVNDIVTSSDPTAFVRISHTGIEQRRAFDRRSDRWEDGWFYLYEAVYENGRRIEFQVNYEFSRSDADDESRYYAIEVGRMPNVLRRDLDNVTIHAGTELWGGGSRNLLIHTGQSRLYAADGIIEETLIHEATHASLDDRYETTSGWKRAQGIDNMFITNYARDYSTREDVAESYLLYLAIRHKPERISSGLERTIRDTMPARIRFFDSLGLDVYPFQ